MSYFAGAEDPLYRFFRRKRGERRVETNPDQTSSDGSKDRLTEKTGQLTVKRLDWCGHQNGSHQPQKCKFLNDWIVFTSETQHKSPVRHKFRLAQVLCDRFCWRHGLYDSALALLGSRPTLNSSLLPSRCPRCQCRLFRANRLKQPAKWGFYLEGMRCFGI